jgi:hypothetical protein
MSITNIDMAVRLKELQGDYDTLYEGFKDACKDNENLRAMNELLRAKLAVTELQHRNCLTMSTTPGTIIKRGE